MPELKGKDNWTPIGWSTSKENIDNIIEPGDYASISKNTTYYAVYKQFVSIKYASGSVGENKNMSDVILPQDSKVARYCVGDQIITEPFTLAKEVKKQGYNFDCWKSKQGVNYRAEDTITIDNTNESEEVFTAIWIPERAIAPTIVTQPKDLEVIYGYENAFMQVTAVADIGAEYTLSYQWYKNTINSNQNGQEITDATNNTVSIEEKSPGTYYFYCKVTAIRTDNDKSSTIVSEPAKFVVEKAERTITIQDLDKTFDKQSVQLTVTVDKGTIDENKKTYTYYKDDNGKFGSSLSSNAPSEPGTYWVEVKIEEDENYKAASASKKFTISYLPTPEKPYTLEVNGNEVQNREWYKDDVIIRPEKGYEIIEFDSVQDNGSILISKNPPRRHNINFYLRQVDTKQITDKISIPVNIDTTEPKGIIEIQQKDSWNDWQDERSNIKYFKETQNVIISGTDEESGVDTISYFCSSEKYDLASEEDIEEVKDKWKRYEKAFPLTPEADYIIYARITDKAGNSSYLNSDKLIFENTKPIITGVSNGGTYYGDVKFKVDDTSGIKSICLGSIDLMTAEYDGNQKCIILDESKNQKCEVTKISDNEYNISPIGNNYSYSITAIDNAGNMETINTFTIYKKFTITFKNGEEEIETQEVNYNQQAVAPQNLPKKAGYSLVGWNKKANGTETEFNLSTPITEDNLILVSRWEANSYQVQFDSRGGSVCSNRTVKYDKQFGIMQKPSRSGYDFVSWCSSIPSTETNLENITILEDYKNNSTIGKITESTFVKPEKDDIITLYALWTPKEYTVTFLGEGGTITVPDNQHKTVIYGKKYGTFPSVNRPGYDFTGWYTDKTSGNKVEPSTVYNNTDDITLYAHWKEKTLKVTLNYNYNSGHMPNGTNEPSVKKVDVVYHDTYDILREENPTRDGYTFDGWYTEQTGGRKIDPTEKVIIQDNTTFYAHWTPKNYTLSFNSKGGSACEEKVVTYGESYNNLPTPEKHGHIFNGWQTEEGNPITNGDYIEIISDTTLVATWNPCTPVVTLNLNGGSFQGVSEEKITVIVTYGKTYLECGLPQEGLIKTGYTFAGWYRKTDDNKKIKIESNSNVDITEPTTFYAEWTADPYEVTFNANAENAIINPPENIDSGIYDTENNILDVTYYAKYGTLPTATKTGYTFTGWYTEAEEGKGIQITKDSIHSVENDRTFYAHWTANNYTVTFDKNTGDTIIPPENVDSNIYDTEKNTLKVTYDAKYGTLPTATKQGYKCEGWYTKTEGGTKIEPNDSVNITRDTTFYAHWTPNRLTFTPQDLAPAKYKELYSQELNKPSGGTGEYQYELAEGSSLPKGLNLIGNIIKGSLEEDVNKGPFEFTIKITDKNSKAPIEQEFTITSQKGEPETPQPPQVISKTSNSVTLKEIDGAVYYYTIKNNEETPTDIKDWTISPLPTITDLNVGTTYNFYIKLKENENYIESSPSEKTEVKTLGIYNITLPPSQEQTQNHYTIKPMLEKSEGYLEEKEAEAQLEKREGETQIEEGGSYSFQIEFDKGYNKTLDFVIYATSTVDGTGKKQKLTADSEGIYTIKNITENKTIVVEGVGDSVYPTGTIKIEGTNGGSWSSFEKNIIYDKFYNKSTIPTIQILGKDEQEGIESISYYVGTEKEIFTESQIYAGKDNFAWKTSSSSETNAKEYTVPVGLESKEGKLIIYAKVKDKGNNTTYLRSQGIIIDAVSPTIEVVSDSETTSTEDSTGITIYETKNTEVPFIIQDEYLKDVTMDGKPFQSFGGKYFVPADGKKHTIVARDKAGNEITHQVQVNVKKCTVTFQSEGDADNTREVSYNQTVEKPVDPQKTGSIFYGWFLNGVEFDFSKPIKEDITLTAKWLLETGDASITAPKQLQVSATQVVLKQEDGYQYCMNDGEPTDTPIFKGLMPGKEYCFYKIDKEGNKSAPLKIKTEETSAATGMMALPSTLYQGEAYKIAPTVAMEGLVNKSADPENTTIAWMVNKPDIVSITNESTEGCTISINQVPYNKNRLTKVTLTATVVYSEMKQDSLVSKTKSYKRSFNVQNLSKDVSIDLSDFSTEPAETGAFVSGSAICLMDKKGVSLKTMINREAEGNIATNQKLKWFISDENGKINRKGKKIASVNGKGMVKGIKPGTTYVTVATADSYDKSTKSYKVFKTCQIICPWVTAISFDSSVEKTVQAGSTLDLASELQCNPEELFNKQKMTKRWKSSDTKVARVNSKGIVTFKKAGTVTITCTPTGGQEIDAATGKVSDTAKDMAAEITFTVQ